MKTFVVGDIHGNYHALEFLLKHAKFNKETDCIIALGDICDGHEFVDQCIDLLLLCKHRIIIQGNHDVWALQWMKYGIELPLWYHQGGILTMMSYRNDHKLVPPSHIALLESAIPYYITPENYILVHGGFIPDIPITQNDIETLLWDRNLINIAALNPIPSYALIFVGHTATQFYTQDIFSNKPIILNNLIMLDTGAGNNGPLSGCYLPNSPSTPLEFYNSFTPNAFK